MEWCFQEVGFGRKGQKRALEHALQTGTNYLLGLFYATVRFSYQKKFELKQYRWCYVAEPEHADFVEVLGTILNGAYGIVDKRDRSFGIGLNPSFAGGAHLNGQNALTNPEYAGLFADCQRLLGKCENFGKHRKDAVDKSSHLQNAMSLENKQNDKKRKIDQLSEEKIALEADMVESTAHTNSESARRQRLSLDLSQAVAALKARKTDRASVQE